jgi:hypothetical protein
MSNVILCRVAAPAHALGGWRVRAFSAVREFSGVLFVILASLDAELASAVAWFAAIHAKAAGVVFPCYRCDVFANHSKDMSKSELE